MSGQVVFGTTSQLFSTTCLLSSASVTQFVSQSFPSHTCCLLPLPPFPFPDSFSCLYSTPLRPHVYFRVKKLKNERNINYKIVLLNYLHLQGLHMDNSHHANILSTSSPYWYSDTQNKTSMKSLHVIIQFLMSALLWAEQPAAPFVNANIWIHPALNSAPFLNLSMQDKQLINLEKSKHCLVKYNMVSTYVNSNNGASFMSSNQG